MLKINTAGITITHSAGTDSVNSLTDAGSLTLSGGVLKVAGNLSVSSTFTLAGGELDNATVTAGTTITGTASPTYSPASGGALSGVTLAGTIDLTEGQRVGITVTGGLTLSGGTINVGGVGNSNWGYLQFSGSQTLGGTGTISFGTFDSTLNALWVSDNNTTLTIGSGITIHGSRGDVGYDSNTSTYPYAVGSTNVAVTNQGTINADTNGGTIIVDGTNWKNDTGGTIEATGGTLDVSQSNRSWSNLGTIGLGSGVLNLGGSFSTAGLGTLSRSGGTVLLTGALNNAGANLTLDAAAGSWVLAGGSISGGTLTTTGGSALVGTASPTYSPASGGALSGVTLAGTIDLTEGQRVGITVTGGLTLSGGTINVGGVGNSNWGYLQFSGSQTLGGTGTISFGTFDSTLNALWVSDNNTTLTVGSGITIHGSRGDVGYDSNTSTYPYAVGSTNVAVTNQGTINADTNGGTIIVDGTNWKNDTGGTIEATGGTLDVSQSNRSWSNLGTIGLGSGVLNLGGSFSTAGLGTLSRSGGTVLLTGALNNAGANLTLDAAAGSWVLAGGSISGGTLTTTGGSALVGTASPTYSPASGGALSGVTLAGTIDLTEGQRVGITVTGGLTLSGGTINVGGVGNSNWGYLQFSGSQTLGGTGTISFGTFDSTLNALWVSDNNTTLTVGSGITIHGSRGDVGYDSNTSTYPYAVGSTNVAVMNQGTINADTNGGTIIVNGSSLQNASGGVLEAQSGGTLIIQASLANLSSGTLTGGTYEAFASSTVRGFASSITTNAATITLSGAGSNFYTGTSGTTDALASLATNSVGGSFTLGGGRTFTAASGFSNAGNLVVGSGGTFTETGTYTQSAATGVTQVDGSLTTTNSTASITGGTLKGTGTITANVTNAASVAPGDSPGILAIAGSYTQTSAGALNLEIGGTNAANPDFDQLHISGTASLAGTLNVSFINGFIPTGGNSFQVMSFASKTGDFTTENGLNLGTSHLAPSYSSSALALVDNPGSITWTGNVSTNWATTGNWDLNRLPNSTDDVFIPSGAMNSVVHSSGADAILSLTTSKPLTLSGGTVAISGTLLSTSTVSLAGGTLAGATILGGTTLTATTSGGTLDGVTLGGVLDLTSALAVSVSVVHDLTLSGGSINIGVNAPGNVPYGYLRFSSTESLKGSGTVTMGGGGNSVLDTLLVVNGGDTLTIGSGITVHGAGAVGYNSNPAFTGGGSPSVSVINQGTIDADIPGFALSIDGSNWNNDSGGKLEVQSGGTLNLGQAGSSRSWSNLGTVTANDGTLSLGGGAGRIQGRSRRRIRRSTSAAASACPLWAASTGRAARST